MKSNMLPKIRVKVATYKSFIVANKLLILIGTAIFLLLISFYIDYQYANTDSNSTIDGIIDETSTVNVTVYGDNCYSCHNKSLSRSGVDTGRCGTCHEQAPHNNPEPPGRFSDIGRKTIHIEHTRSVTNQKSCQGCHAVPACNSCHSGHASTPEFNVSKTCQECHGGFPEPRGHKEQRLAFKESAHSWMGRCSACHQGTELKFKTLATYNLTNSSQLCSNCHVVQYKDTSHYSASNVGGIIIENRKCVDCHDPHVGLKPKIALGIPSSVTIGINNIFNILVNNAAWTVLIIILICSIIIEYIFRPQKGNIILSKRLRVEHSKLNARAIRITSSQKLSSSILYELTDVFDRNNIELLGISAGNDETVIFANITKKDKKKIIEDIISISGILKAEYTKDYDVR